MTSVEAMEALVVCRCRISPARRWEKKSMGRWNIFHMYSAFPTAAIFPPSFRE